MKGEEKEVKKRKYKKFQHLLFSPSHQINLSKTACLLRQHRVSHPMTEDGHERPGQEVGMEPQIWAQEAWIGWQEVLLMGHWMGGLLCMPVQGLLQW